jgi:hypothetical protein
LSKHLLIAGTGRAGTSFLVRYLTRIGFDTHLSRAGSAAIWDESANAGLENLALPDLGDLPYVVKSPWTYQFIQELLGSPALEIDAVVIPMRDLMEAAASRCIMERQAMHSTLPWLRDRPQTWEHFSHTPGGIVFSTTPVDQARLLAVGFHHLLNQLITADIPVILLSFPRLIEDAGYLHRKFAETLPHWVSEDESRVAHAETADRDKVRVGAEISTVSDSLHPGLTLVGPGNEHLDQVALGRLRNRNHPSLRDPDPARPDHAGVAEEVPAAVMPNAMPDPLHSAMAVQELRQDRDRLSSELQAMRDVLDHMTQQRNQAHAALNQMDSSLTQTRLELQAIHAATTWQIALRLQSLARHMAWAVPVARRLFRSRSSLPASERVSMWRMSGR